MQRKRKILSLIAIFMLCIGVMTQVNASSFKDSYYGDSKTTLFDSTSDTVAINQDSYPFNQKNVKVKSVGFDAMYGMTKQLVRYKGEIPYKETRDADSGIPFSGLGNIPFREHTSIVDDTNPSYMYNGKLLYKTTVEDYWGKGVKSTEDEVSRATLEKVNDDSIKSLRLYAAQKSTVSISVIAYLLSGIIWLGTQIITLVLMIKNISMTTLFEALHIDSLSKTMNEVFISSGGVLSPLVAFSIISLLFVVVGFVFRFLKGSETLKSLFTNVLLVSLIGLCIIGVSLTGKVGTLASTGANFTNKMLISVNPAMLQSDGIFLTDTVGGDSSKDLLMQEMSMINKINIDVQICTQFGVQKMSDLNFEALGDKDGKIAVQTLSGLENPKQVANNLGYYYWYANSGAYSLDRTSVPKISDTQQVKLGSMITYLQKMYNANDKNPDIQENIKQMILSLSSPSGLSGVVYAIMLIVIYTLLALSLWRFCIACALSKIEFAAALLGLPAAGLLMFSGKKSYVKTGKGILGILISSLIKVILYSAIFDIILYIVSAVLKANFISFVLVLILVTFFYKSRKLFEDHINQIVQSIERAYAPEASQLKRQVKSSFNQAMNRKSNEAGQKKKLIGYDENGNPIYKDAGKLRQAIFRVAADASASSATSRYGMRKITTDTANSITKANTDATDKLSDAEYRKQKSKLDAALKDVRNDASDRYKSTKDENGNYINEMLAKGKEQDLNKKIKSNEDDIEKLINSAEYKHLISKENPTNKENERLTNIHKAIEHKEKTAREMKSQLDDMVKERVFLDAQAEHADSLKEALTDEIAAAEEKAKNHSKHSTRDIENIIKHKKALKSLNSGKRVDEVSVTSNDVKLAQDIVRKGYDSSATDKAAGILKLNIEKGQDDDK